MSANTTAQHFDAIVIGAGIVGSGVALELTRSGKQVAFIDRNSGAGQGSTSASSAIVRFQYSTWEGVVTSWEAKFGWQRWSEHLGAVDPQGMARYTATGVFTWDFPGFDSTRVMELFDKIGIPYERLSASEIAQRFPYFETGTHHPPKTLDDPAFWQDSSVELGGFYCPAGGFVDDPSLAAHNLAHAAIVHGATPFYRSTVTRVLRGVDVIEGVELNGTTVLTAPVVVNCAGPHSRAINELAGDIGAWNVTTGPMRQEVHHLADPTNFTIANGAPVTFDGDLGTYFRPDPGGIMVGGMEPECEPLDWLHDADEANMAASLPVYEAQTTRLARRIPTLQVPPRPRGVVGIYDVSDDWIPIYDKTSLPGYYVAIGTSGNQFKNAPVIGQIMARLIDQVEQGADHDGASVTWVPPYTGLPVDLHHYSRLRSINRDSSFSVLG